ncbi:hypothetical protein Hanom_Chr07g00615071 [Helianthus anomalus]
MRDLMHWCVRSSDDPFDPDAVYGDGPTLFSIQVFHGGYIQNYPGRRYVHGKMNYVDMIDGDEFSGDDVVYYHFRIPGQNLDNGLRALGTNQDVLNMCQYIDKVKVIDVYVKHWVTRLSTYFQSPNGGSNVVIEEIIDAGPSNPSTSSKEWWQKVRGRLQRVRVQRIRLQRMVVHKLVKIITSLVVF